MEPLHNFSLNDAIATTCQYDHHTENANNKTRIERVIINPESPEIKVTVSMYIQEHIKTHTIQL